MNGELGPGSRRGRRVLVIALLGSIAAGLVPVAVLVWPTRYRYDHMNVRGNILPVRIHRLSGITEVLHPGGWKRAELAPPNIDEQVPYSEVAKLALNATVWGRSMYIDLYNASGWEICEITVTFSLTGPGEEAVLSRQYRVRGDPVPRLSNGRFTIDLGLWVPPNQEWSWYLVAAKGSPD